MREHAEWQHKNAGRRGHLQFVSNRSTCGGESDESSVASDQLESGGNRGRLIDYRISYGGSLRTMSERFLNFRVREGKRVPRRGYISSKIWVKGPVEVELTSIALQCIQYRTRNDVAILCIGAGSLVHTDGLKGSCEQQQGEALEDFGWLLHHKHAHDLFHGTDR